LRVLAEHRNFGRAAAALYITQPALSRSIQALEREVGATLVDRRSSGVELTDMGELVVRHATALDAAARDLDREVRLAQDLELGELRIGAGPWGGSVLVAPVVGRLNALHPRLRMRVVVAPWRELPARTRARDVDLMVGGFGDVAQLDDFELVSLGAHDTVVVGRVGHPLDLVDDVTPGDVFAYPLVGPGMDSDSSDLLAALARTVGDRPAARELLTVECDSSDVLKQVLLESDALTFMPRFLVAPTLGAGALTVIEGATPGPRVEFGAAWLRGRSLGRAGTTFLDLLRAHHDALSAHTA
jgi:DNA-binding transcriptional LysR family regulator